jgi:hypothetical protein
MNITEFENEMISVVSQFELRFHTAKSTARRQRLAGQAQRKVRQLVKRARHKINARKVQGRWDSYFSWRTGGLDRSTLPDKLNAAEKKALAEIERLLTTRSEIARHTRPSTSA